MPVVFPFRRLDALVVFDDVFVPWESVFRVEQMML